METQLKQPTQPRKVSDDDNQRINKFKSFILDNGAAYVRHNLLRMYFDYTQLMAKHPYVIYTESADQLYELQLIIELLE